MRLVYSSVLPRLRASGHYREPRLGFAKPSYNGSLVHDQEFFIDLAIDLGDRWSVLQHDEMVDDAGVRRIIREYLIETAIEMEDYVSKMPEPLRRVAQLRSEGLSWKKVMNHPLMEGRAYFSVMEDWERVQERVWRDRSDLVRRLI
jgi:hypothetical protein